MDILIAILKGLASGAEAAVQTARDHMQQVDDAKAQVNAKAKDALDAVTGSQPASQPG